MYFDRHPPKKYHCEAKKHCNSCPLLCCPLLEVEPRPGKIHHPKMPMPNPIRKVTNDKLSLETQRKLQRLSDD